MSTSKTLRDLVIEARQRRDMSGRQLALHARKNGYRIVATTLNGIEAGTYKSRPSAETLKAIAFLAGVPEQEAFAAAGLPTPGPPFADELPPGVDLLSPKRRKVVIDLLRVLVEDEEVDRAHGAPMTPAANAPDLVVSDRDGNVVLTGELKQIPAPARDDLVERLRSFGLVVSSDDLPGEGVDVPADPHRGLRGLPGFVDLDEPMAARQTSRDNPRGGGTTADG